MGKIKGLLTAAVLSLFLAAMVHAGPPLRPMTIHGEVMADGVGVPEGSEIRLTLAGFGEIVNATAISNGTGLSYYRIDIPADNPETTGVVEGGGAGSQISFVSLKLSGFDRQLGGIINSVNWREGVVLRRDILINPGLTAPPAIINASALKEDDLFSLACNFSPVQTTEDVSYRVAWYKAVMTDGHMNSVLLAEEAYRDITGVKRSELNATSDGEANYLEVIVTPVLSDGKRGPSAYRKVFYEVTGGGL